MKLAFGGKLSKWSIFHGDSGALALYNLKVSEPFSDCPPAQLFIVPAVLRLIIPFAKSTFCAIGWDAESDVGYTLHALFERQLAHAPRPTLFRLRASIGVWRCDLIEHRAALLGGGVVALVSDFRSWSIESEPDGVGLCKDGGDS